MPYIVDAFNQSYWLELNLDGTSLIRRSRVDWEDVEVVENAVELAKMEVKRKQPGRIMFCSMCFHVLTPPEGDVESLVEEDIMWLLIYVICRFWIWLNPFRMAEDGVRSLYND